MPKPVSPRLLTRLNPQGVPIVTRESTKGKPPKSGPATLARLLAPKLKR